MSLLLFGQVDNACYIGSIYDQPVDATDPTILWLVEPVES